MLVQETVGVTLSAMVSAAAAQISMQLVALEGVRMQCNYIN